MTLAIKLLAKRFALNKLFSVLFYSIVFCIDCVIFFLIFME